MRPVLIGLSTLSLAACQPSGDTQPAISPSGGQAASTPTAWAETFPQYPILHDRTIEQDLWAFTHEVVNTCGTSSDHVRIWAVRKGFSQGKTLPELVINPKAGRTADDAYQEALSAYVDCAVPISQTYVR